MNHQNENSIFSFRKSKYDRLFGVMAANLVLEDYSQSLTSDPRDRDFALPGLAYDGLEFDQFINYSRLTEDTLSMKD